MICTEASETQTCVTQGRFIVNHIPSMCLKIKKYNFEGRTHPFTFIPQEFQGQMCVNLTLGEVVSAPREYK